MKETAILAGGCFWCMVKPFDQFPGVHSITSGYTGGHKKNPTYEEVCSGTTGHTEAVKIDFDSSLISYKELLTIYWQQTDPTDAFGQFQDRGESYRPVIFYTTKEQKQIAENSKQELADSKKYTAEIVTTIEPASDFYSAEEYHQNFYKKNPTRYNLSSQKRKNFLKEVWKED